MRRTRFAGAVEITGEARERVSIGEALRFDVRAPDTPDEHSLLALRVAALDHSALMLGITHLIAAVAMLALHPDRVLAGSFANPVIPMSLLLALDVAAMGGLHLRDRLNLAPHTIIRGLAAYLTVAGTLWILVGLA